MDIAEGQEFKIPDGMQFAGRFAKVLFVFLYATVVELRNGQRVEFTNYQMQAHGVQPLWNPSGA